MNRKKTFKNTAIALVVGISFLGIFTIGTNYIYDQSVMAMGNGEYDKAVKGLELVLKIKKDKVVSNKLEVAKYEREVIPIVEEFLKQLTSTHANIEVTNSIREVQSECRLLKSIFKQMDNVSEQIGSELSDYVKAIKEHSSYDELKNNFVFGSKLSELESPVSIGLSFDWFSLSMAQGAPMFCIEDLLNQEKPIQLLNKIESPLM